MQKINTTLITETDKRRSILKIQSEALHAVHEFFRKEGFFQLMPIILSPVTDPLGPDPGSEVIKTGEIEYLGQRLMLTQSMILHKQIAIASGIDKLYIISPNVRLEAAQRGKTGIHAFEFSQIDFETAGASMDDVFGIVEKLLRYIRVQIEHFCKDDLKVLERKIPNWETVFPAYTSHQLIEKYGEDWEKLSSLEETTPYWVVCHDREFYDKADRDRPDGHFLNYDLYYPEGFLEALSGAEREFEYEFLIQRIDEDELRREPYEDYLKLAKDGELIPSAGAGLGVERLVRYLTGMGHIGEVQLFRRIPGEEVRF